MLLEGTKSVSLPAGTNAEQLPNVIYLQDDAIDEVDLWRHEIPRIDSKALRRVVANGIPSGYSCLTLETLDFNTFADRDYRVFFKALKAMAPLAEDAVEVDYPDSMINYILSYACFLYYESIGMPDQGAPHLAEARVALTNIHAQEHNARPYRYHKHGSTNATPMVWWNQPY